MKKGIKKVVRFAKGGFFGKDGEQWYLPTETIISSIKDAIGLPVYLEHNTNTEPYGFVVDVYRETGTDWFLADIIITNENIARAIENQKTKYKLSNSYDVLKGKAGDFKKDGLNYQRYIEEIEWRELSFTQMPRYEDAVILNSIDTVIDCDFVIKQGENKEMNKIVIGGKEYDENFVLNAVENFSKEKGFLDHIKEFFTSKVDNSEEVIEPEVDDKVEPVVEQVVEDVVETELDNDIVENNEVIEEEVIAEDVKASDVETKEVEKQAEIVDIVADNFTSKVANNTNFVVFNARKY